MTINDLPRPWLLAALADVPIIELAGEETRDVQEDERQRALPRADRRRRRLADWRAAGRRCGGDGDRLN